MVTIQAVPAPAASVTTATPVITTSVVLSASGRIVRHRCGHVEKSADSARNAMAPTGSAVSATMAPTATAQPRDTGIPARRPDGRRSGASHEPGRLLVCIRRSPLPSAGNAVHGLSMARPPR